MHHIHLRHPFRHSNSLFWIAAIALLVGLILFAVLKINGLGHMLRIKSLLLASQAKEVVSNVEPASYGPFQPLRQAKTTGPLTVDTTNRRYFMDANGKLIYLTGSHTWLNFQDGVLTDPPPAFNYTGYLNFLVANNHNFFRLWTWEEAKWVTESSSPYYFSPLPYQRTGPGNALDNKPKFDLTRFNDAYFQRLHDRVVEAGNRGIYVSVMLFDGWSISFPKENNAGANPWLGHPYNTKNNINGINGDTNNNNSGDEVETLAVDPRVTQLQEAYVKKVIDTVGSLDNVLYEITNESNGGAAQTQWQYHMIQVIIDYEKAKNIAHHPIGMTSEFPNGNNADLFSSNADWISPNGGLDNPPASGGSKVVVADTDHLCGICGDKAWVWKAFTRGQNTLFMDQYDDGYKLNGGGYNINNTNDVLLRKNMGYTLTFASCMNMKLMTPHGELASSSYALANPSASNPEYLVYLPNGGTVNVDLSGTVGPLAYAWLNPSTGNLSNGGTMNGGGKQSFNTPFVGDAVLYIYKVIVPANPPPPPPGQNRHFYIPFILHPSLAPTNSCIR